MVKWSAIQTLLEEDQSDVLILLDCCASGTANACEGTGVNELISACAWNETANGVGPYSFTSALVIELRRLSQKASFSVGELYRNIFWRIQSRMPEDPRQEGKERERHPAPIHLVLTQDTVPRSIQLSVRQQRSQLSVSQTLTESNSCNTQIDSTSGSSESGLGQPTISRHPTEENNIAKSSVQPSKKDVVVDKSKVPRLAFAIRLEDSFRPGEDIKDLFLQWLRDMPNIAKQVKIEAGFDAFSTLVIVSLPIDVCAYLSRDPAIISLGPIVSGNRVVADAGACSSDNLSGLVPRNSRTMETEAHLSISSGSSESLQFIPNIPVSESRKGKMPEIYVENTLKMDAMSRDSDLAGSQTNVPEIAPQFAELAMTPVPVTHPMQSKYATVTALLLCWEVDSYRSTMLQSQISKQKLKLAEVFTQLYGFRVEHWAIPDLDSHNQLTRRISMLTNTGSHLNIIYYVGQSGTASGDVVWRRYLSSATSGIFCTAANHNF